MVPSTLTMTPDRITKWAIEQQLPQYRITQALKAVVKEGIQSWEALSTWPKALREKAQAELPIQSLTVHKVLVSSQKNAIKAALKTADGNLIETVLMQPKPEGDWTTCISSQVGCAMACTFCATGKMGLMRNLTAEEITDQVLFWIQYMHEHNLGERPFNIVYMGMGEPLNNWKEVDESVRLLTSTFEYGDRHISISTSGIVTIIPKLAKAWPQVNLAISLHSANNDQRSKLMPVNKSFDLIKLQNALIQYFEITNRKVFLEYILLNGINDTSRNVKEIVKFVEAVGKPKLLHVNLIVYNKTKSDYVETPRDHASQFRDALLAAGVSASIRKNLGRDIAGACGQLAGEEKEEKKS